MREFSAYWSDKIYAKLNLVFVERLLGESVWGKFKDAKEKNYEKSPENPHKIAESSYKKMRRELQQNS